MAVLTLAMIAGALAIGAFSSTVFLWQWLTGTRSNAAVLALLITAVVVTVSARIARIVPRATVWSWSWMVVAAASSFAAYWIGRILQAAPHGAWDGWTVWNLHARFLFRGETSWKDLFDPVLKWSQNQYPLLLPGFVSGTWTIVGADEQWIPALIASLFTALTIGITGAGVSVVAGSARGGAAALVLLATPSLLLHTAGQMADIPLSVYILTAVVLLRFSLTWPEWTTPLLVCAGLSAGFAAWTKMEGLIFAIVLLGSPLVLALRSPRSDPFKNMFRIAAGLAPMMLLVLAFRTFLAPAVGMRLNVSSTFERLSDLSRYQQVATHFVEGVLNFGDAGGGLHPGFLLLLLVLAAAMSNTKVCWRSLALLIIPAFVFAAYFAVYMVTPYDVSWHLAYSLDRLLLHLWPATTFIVAASFVPVPAADAQTAGTGSRSLRAVPLS